MQYILSKHAQVQMKLRKVTEAEVVFTLGNYLTTYPAHHGGTTIVAYFNDKTRLKVWLANATPLQEPFFVKSVGRREFHV
jgi:hypothetical protein